jgi:predicted nucleic acid-binding protein
MVEGIAAGLAAHDAAVGRWRRTGPRHLSVVDATSFVVMAARKIDRAFAFDHGFVRARLGLLA